MSEGLICPNSGEPCDYLSFCASRKEALEEGGDMATVLAQYTPEEISEALNDAGFCANRRIEALADVAESDDVTPEVASEAIMIAARTLAARDMFPTPDPTEAA